MKTGKELNLTIEQCINLMDERVYQYRSAGLCVYEKGYYIKGNPYHSSYGKPGADSCWVLHDSGEVSQLFSDLSHHRALQALKAWKEERVNMIPGWVWENYITNGYNTRRGLYADYSSKEERIKNIALSHADYMGNETWSSSIDHNQRARMRNA